MSSWGLRMTTRTSPPTRRSTWASDVSQSCSACHQRRITSSLVHASKTARAGAWKVRSMCRVLAVTTSQALHYPHAREDQARERGEELLERNPSHVREDHARSGYSSCRCHHSYGGVCGYPSGESSHSSWRPSAVRSR